MLLVPVSYPPPPQNFTPTCQNNVCFPFPLARQTRCSDGCSYTSRDGTKGRRCDSSCETGAPYGTKGCHAREGKYGPDCRVCYYDVERALAQIEIYGEPGIM